MATIKVQDDIDGLIPWDLKLDIGGREYATRRPRLGLIMRLRKLPSLSTDEFYRLLPDLFEDPPPLEELYDEQVAQIVSAYLVHYGELSRKNAPTVARLTKQWATGKTATTDTTGTT